MLENGEVDRLLGFTPDRANFDEPPFVARIEKPWGYELSFRERNPHYASKLLHIAAGHAISFQIHNQKEETQVLISGRANRIWTDAEGHLHTEEMLPFYGYTNYIGQPHSLEAMSDCDIVESSTPEDGDTIRINDRYGRPTETEEMRAQPNRGWNG